MLITLIAISIFLMIGILFSVCHRMGEIDSEFKQGIEELNRSHNG